MQDDIKARVNRWLSEQGYPLEFATAAAFSSAGFRVHQGLYVEDSESAAPREIDVLAEYNQYDRDDLIRIEFVVECKWSVGKPWVIFTSRGKMAPSACVAQTLGSLAGQAALWACAGDPSLHALDTFATPEMPGFGGRQAFSTGRDTFYETLKSVASLAHARAIGYDKRRDDPADHLHLASVVLPVVVLRGQIFTARFDTEDGQLVLEDVSSARIHWRGSDKWSLHTTIDVLTETALLPFVEKRKKEVDHMAVILGQSMRDLRRCAQEGTLEAWPVTSGPRGYIGRPRLLVELRRSARIKPAAEPHRPTDK